MRKLIIGVCLLMLISSCGGGKKKMDPFETLTEEIDSLTATPDTTEAMAVVEEERLSGNFWLVIFKIRYLCLPLFYETRTTPSCHPSGCAYRQL